MRPAGRRPFALLAAYETWPTASHTIPPPRRIFDLVTKPFFSSGHMRGETDTRSIPVVFEISAVVIPPIAGGAARSAFNTRRSSATAFGSTRSAAVWLVSGSEFGRVPAGGARP